MEEKALQLKSPKSNLLTILAAARAWAEATTDRTLERHHDLINDKSKVVASFYALTGKDPAEVGTPDVKEWQAKMEEQGVTASTIYTRTSMLSSFYRWAMANTPLKALAQEPGNVAAKCDYALLQWYVKTGCRRCEVISLLGSDVQVKDFSGGGAAEQMLIVRYRIKGGATW